MIRKAFISALICLGCGALLLGCSDVPNVKPLSDRELAALGYPKLVPLDDALLSAETSLDEDSAAALDAKARRLKSEARALRQQAATGG